MSNNALLGGIPSSFFTIPSLTILYLSNNTFSGTIPSNFGDSTSLVALWLDGNKLNGTIPDVPTPSGWPRISECFYRFLFMITHSIIMQYYYFILFFLTEEVLLDQNLITGSVPTSICDLRERTPINFTTYNFTTLHADCEPPTLVLGQAQVNCRNLCCTACSIGVLV